MTDSVLIEGLKVKTIIGAYDWEQSIKQTLLLDLELFTDIRPAATTDDLTQALDYTSISLKITEFLEQSHFQLIETVAEEVAALLLKNFKIMELALKVSKPSALESAANVAVYIRRKK